MAHDVFISHSAKDKVTADAVCAVLESEGVRCWIAPRDVIPGMEWSECIIEAIEQTRVMVLVFTADANASPQIRREVERAVNHGVAILPVRIEDVMPGRALEYFIGNVHWLDALTPPLEAHLKNLAGTVKMLLARMDQNPPPMPRASAGRVPDAAKPPEPAVASPAKPAAVLHAEPDLADGHQAAATTGILRAPQPVEVRKPLDSPEESATRKSGESEAEGATSAPSRLGRVPVWTWAVVIASALLLVAVFIGVQFASEPGPAGSPPQSSPGGAARGPAPAPEPATSNPNGPSETAPAASPLPVPAPRQGGSKSEKPNGVSRAAAPATPPGQTTPPHAAPPLAPAPVVDNATLLQETMSTLQNELSSIGTVSYTIFGQKKANGSSFQNATVEQVSNVIAGSAQCRLSHHWTVWQNGAARPSLDKDSELPLHDVTSIVVEPMAQEMTKELAATGMPEVIVTSTVPFVTALVARWPGGSNTFALSDATLANDTAATLKQAVQLCGGHIAN